MTEATKIQLEKDARIRALQIMSRFVGGGRDSKPLHGESGSGHDALAIGQEACSAGVALALQPGDTVTCTYRGHGHALALGMPLRSMMAEMMGKESGACKGAAAACT